MDSNNLNLNSSNRLLLNSIENKKNNKFCLWWFFHSSCNVYKYENEFDEKKCILCNCCSDCLELKCHKKWIFSDYILECCCFTIYI